ncbi:MAG: hypothetical protein JSR48_04740, partial [Verrucomicrobia bacterium]|nr:hypothetical protein [Verrucomicrobiota bacterium]
ITLATSLGLSAAAAYLLSHADTAMSADTLIGSAAVFALLAMAALEYRIRWKDLIGR